MSRITGSLRTRLGFLLAANVVAAVVMSQLSPYFLTLGNAQAMLQFGAVIALLALGQTLVIVTGGGGIDLSVGSMLSLSGVLFGLMATKAGVPLPLAAVLAVLAGAVLGAFNGIMITGVGIPPIIATLGTLYLYGSLAVVMTNGVPISGFPDSFGFLGQRTLAGIPTQVLLVLAPVALLLGWVVARTALGRSIYLVGVNELAARLTGIAVERTRIVVYALSGALAGLGAIVTTSWLMSARPDAGSGYELQAITVAVLGGTNIMGGEGTLGGALLAVLVVTMVGQGLQLADVDPTWQLGILGLLLLLAVMLNEFVLRRPARSPVDRPAPPAPQAAA
jgi:ribose transport system permease protein/rhamnose transport system permease protein